MEAQEIANLADAIAEKMIARQGPIAAPAPQQVCQEHAGLVQEIRNSNNQYYELNQAVKKIQSGQETLISKLVKVEKRFLMDKFSEERRKNEELQKAMEKKEQKGMAQTERKDKNRNEKIAHWIAGASIIATLIGQIIVNVDAIKNIFMGP